MSNTQFQKTSFLLEFLLRSDKNYGVNLDLFPNKVKTLFICGLSGSEKQMLADRIKKNIPNCEIISLDQLWTKQMEKNILKTKIDENVSKTNLRLIGDYLKRVTKDKSKCRIIEGVHFFYLYQLYGDSFLKYLKDYPMILLGTSAIRSAFNMLKKNVFTFKFKNVLYSMFDDNEYNKFKQKLLSDKSNQIEEVKL